MRSWRSCPRVRKCACLRNFSLSLRVAPELVAAHLDPLQAALSQVEILLKDHVASFVQHCETERLQAAASSGLRKSSAVGASSGTITPVHRKGSTGAAHHGVGVVCGFFC